MKPRLLALIEKIQRELTTTTPWVFFRIYESAKGDVHWSIIVHGDKTISITLTKEGPPQIQEAIFEGLAEEFVNKAVEVIPKQALENLPKQMELWLKRN
jgi:hypothetical protein